MTPSVEDIPVSTSSGVPPVAFFTASASTSEVAAASEPWMASSSTCTPAWAPIWSAFLIASAAACRADRQHGDLTLARGLDDLQRLLDGVLVELGQQPVDTLTVDGAVGVAERALGLGVRDVLDTDDDVHACLVLFLRAWLGGPRRAGAGRAVDSLSR